MSDAHDTTSDPTPPADAADTPGASPQKATDTAAPKPKSWLRRRWKRVLGVALLLGLICIGPWPADNSTYVASDYETSTLAAIGTPTIRRGPARLGVAEVDITPDIGHPLAGFGGRRPKAATSIHSHCYLRAMSITVDDLTVTVLAADMLMINAKLAAAILDRAGLEPGDVYFTATHTHSGPGGWGDHPLEVLLDGDYDPAYFDKLAGLAADVVKQSRDPAAATPVDVATVTYLQDKAQRNRVTPGGPTFDQMSILMFRPHGDADAKPAAMLATYGPHATVCGQFSHAVSADYPGGLVDTLKARTGAGMVMFAAGAVGDATANRPKADTPEQRADELGRLLGDHIADQITHPRWQSEITLGNWRIGVDLPSLRVPVTRSLRLSPVCTNWIADRHTHLHALRIGDAVLTAMPGDVAGSIAQPLADHAAQHGVTSILTSFNGDYRGYIIAADVFNSTSHYETRTMNFYGPQMGPYMLSLAERLTDGLTAKSGVSGGTDKGEQ
ncbi:MAG: hypothetical protein GC159_10490 [Phycisphaera sp.]|nr:hypothetical protein [Phycisphaera sp.]